MAFRYSIQKEYKPRGAYKYKQVRCNRSLYGEIREYPKAKGRDGRPVRIYWAVRLQGEHVQKHLAWAFDKLMIDKIREEGIPLTHIGVMVTADINRRAHIEDKVEELWLITRDEFFKRAMREDSGELKPWNYSHKGGSNQYLIPMAAFGRILRETDPEVKLKEMSIRGRK